MAPNLNSIAQTQKNTRGFLPPRGSRLAKTQVDVAEQNERWLRAEAQATLAKRFVSQADVQCAKAEQLPARLNSAMRKPQNFSMPFELRASPEMRRLETLGDSLHEFSQEEGAFLGEVFRESPQVQAYIAARTAAKGWEISWTSVGRLYGANPLNEAAT